MTPRPEICFCGREARGFYYEPALAAGAPRVGKHSKTGERISHTSLSLKVPCCSMACLAVVFHKKAVPPVLTKYETAALDAASVAAGKFIETTAGGTDMARWPVETWRDFLECVITAYAAELRAQVAVDGPPPF